MSHRVFGVSDNRLLLAFLVVLFLGVTLSQPLLATTEESASDNTSHDRNDLIQREELGVNPITAPSIQQLLAKLESFGAIPEGFIDTNPRQVSFSNRFQAALHLGSLVADGLLLTIAERENDLLDLSRALIRDAKSLNVADRLMQRGKSLLDLSSKGDWLGMRRELISTQEDVEQSLMDLRDDVLADVISMGGWIRGFQFACTVTDSNYVSQRAQMLVDAEIMDYYIDRLENLGPQLRKTGLVQDMTATLKSAREITLQAPDQGPSHEDVHRLKLLADHLFADIIAPTDSQGDLLAGPSPVPALLPGR